MHGLAHLLDQGDASEAVLVIDFDNLACINATVSNVSEWGCRLLSKEVGELRKNIGIRVGETGKLTKGQVTAVKGSEASVVFPRSDAKVQDKRRERRNRVSIPVTVTDKDGGSEIAGTIVDAGPNGCRISAKGLEALPEEVLLTIKKFDKPVLGEFAWRNKTSAGLRLYWDLEGAGNPAEV
jgi:hypothetical protein